MSAELVQDKEQPYLPEDNTFYVKESRLAQQPEMDLWEFCETKANQNYLDYAFETGATLDKDYVAEPIHHLNLDSSQWLDWALKNKDSCQKKYYEQRPYHTGINKMAMDLPMNIGYNHRNTVEYNWGLYGNSAEEIKEMLGGREAFREMNIDYDTAMPRFLVYLPGNVLPWHFDTLNGWCRDNADLNPRVADGTDISKGAAGDNICDLGYVKRYLVMVNDWHWGHVLQMENSFFPRWKSGEVYDIPSNVYHLSANAGVEIKMTCSITGVKYFD
jgi:hypothetical protein